jgi:hypothetical protein
MTDPTTHGLKGVVNCSLDSLLEFLGVVGIVGF